MKYFEFTEKEKAAMFDEIMSHFYCSNFGQMAKADMELLMFHFYMEKMISSFAKEDGTVDYVKCSDYYISKELGITQQRVRNLKIKNQLVYPMEYDWTAAFAKLIENARYDKTSGKVVIQIPDPNLFLEIQNFIEEKGAFVEKQLNGKILQIRTEYFIDLIVSMENPENEKKIIKELKKIFKEHSKEEEVFDEKNIGKSFLTIAGDTTSIIANIYSVLSPINCIGSAVAALLKK